MKYIECVPNISEGRRPEIVKEIAAQVDKVKEAYLLDISSDSDHNRSVITFAGIPEAVSEAAFQLTKRASRLIDLNKHEGKHPRMGATDVVPFIPLSGAQMEDCIKIAVDTGKRIGFELGIPVFLYEYAATRKERKNLADVRHGEFEGLREEIGKNPDKTPDFGPNKIHPTAGATVIGAREFLIAYNVNLNSPDISIARTIAKKIRTKDGGLPAVKALGLFLPEKGITQVSMNLVNFKTTSIEKVYQEIEKEAEKHNVEIIESELIGLMPQSAYYDGLEKRTKIDDFSLNQIVENRLQKSIKDKI
ncbi:MAG: glutamate formimidoyltransferase [Planctomycetota bacterium]